MRFWLEFLGVMAALLIGVYVWARKRYKYFEERGVPFVPPSFPLGNTGESFLGRAQMTQGFDRIYQKLRGHRLAGLFQVFKPTFIVMDPDLVHKVLIKNFSSFYSHGIPIDEKTNPLEGHLFNLEGEKWRVLRKKLSPTFTSGKLKWMFNQMSVCGDFLMKALDEEVTPGEDVEVRDLMARFTTDVIGSCAFGFEPESIRNKDSKFRVMGNRIFSASLKDMFLLGLRLVFPRFFFTLKLRTIPREIHDFFYSIVSQTFEHRTRTGTTRNDFMQLLLELREKGTIEYDPRDVLEDYVSEKLTEDGDDTEADKLELTEDVLTAQAFVFFAAGFETSATSLSMTLYYLATNPEAQERLVKEVREVKDLHQGRIDYDSLKDMTYLDACVSETMRMSPPFQAIFRECTRDTVLDGVPITKGTSLILPMVSIQNDPAYFDRPEEFRPERFLDDQPRPGTYFPFGDGPRICIARRFALVEVKMALAKIIDVYGLRPSPKMKEPVELEPRSFIAIPRGGIWVKFYKRNN